MIKAAPPTQSSGGKEAYRLTVAAITDAGYVGA